MMVYLTGVWLGLPPSLRRRFRENGLLESTPC